MRLVFSSIVASVTVLSMFVFSNADQKHGGKRSFYNWNIPYHYTCGKHINEKPILKFGKNGKFKIVQFTDTQDDQDIDPRTVALISTVLDDQKPDMVVFTGDNIRRGPKTISDVEKAIDNIVRPVNDRRIPWLITFGNHDEEVLDATGIDKEGMLEMYRSYNYNINKACDNGISGCGNMQAFVYNSKITKPVFNIWVLDGGEYAPDSIAGQSLENLPGWDWIKPDQINWYRETSKDIESTYKKKINSLMFFHIPLWEFKDMWAHKELHNVTGEKNEEECPGAFNSGLFSALLERGDVRGVFVGHDHVNNYVGNYYGIYLGYSANTGFGTYGLDGTDANRLRGARVFEIDQDTPNQFTTKMVYARDYGIQ